MFGAWEPLDQAEGEAFPLVEPNAPRAVQPVAGDTLHTVLGVRQFGASLLELVLAKFTELPAQLVSEDMVNEASGASLTSMGPAVPKEGKAKQGLVASIRTV